MDSVEKIPKSKIQMPNKTQNPNDPFGKLRVILSRSKDDKNKKKYDLEERTAKFGEDIIEFANGLPNMLVNRPLISQIVRSGTSIGANYMEADGAESKKDFQHKIGICKKESKETMHWLRMIAKASPDKKDRCRQLWQEAHEFALIFSAIIVSSSDISKTRFAIRKK